MRNIAVSAVIPAFNEEGAVSAVVQGVRDVLSGCVQDFEVLVVDDGSSDGTGAAALKAGAVVLRNPANQGYGQSLETGIKAARHEWILMLDADGSYPPEEIPKLLDYAPDFDLVIGMRSGVHFWGSFFHAFLRWFYLRIASFVVGERVPDANSGLRLVRKSLVSQPEPVRCLGYSHSTTMTLSFLKAGRFVKFVPIEYRLRRGRSKVRPIRDMLRTMQIMTQILLAYNPLKLFMALAFFPAGLSLVLAAAFVYRGADIWAAMAGLAMLAALLCFLAGCVIDAIRMQRGRADESS